MLLINFCVDEEGRYLGNTRGRRQHLPSQQEEGEVSMFDVFEEIWRGMKEERMITGEEYLHTNFPQYYRTREELLAPLRQETPTNPVLDALGLVVERCETRVVKCPYRETFEAGGYRSAVNKEREKTAEREKENEEREKKEEAERFARAYIKTLRSWSEGVFYSGLEKDSRSQEEKTAIVDTLYDRYQALVAAHPRQHSMDYVHCYMLIKKK